MKSKIFSRTVAVVLTVMLLVGLIPMTAFASISDWSQNNVIFDGATFGTNGYYNVISKKDYTLVPGAAAESEIVLNNAGGDRRQVMHIIELDPSNPNVSVLPGYYGIDQFAADPTDVSTYTAAGVTDVAKYYDTTLGYQVVGAMNTGLAYDNTAPFSYLVYNGQVLVDAKGGVNNFHSGTCQTLLCVYKDAVTGECSCELRTHAQGLRGDEWQAIGANFAMTVNNGELVAKTVSRSSGAARSMVGVKEDGTLVLVMNDGRGANNSIGFSDYEEGEAMLALGCKWAFNCDGGGSSSFVTRRAGEDDLVCRCVPCDGAERPTLNSVIVVSNVAPTGVLNNVEIQSDYDIFAPGSVYSFGTKAIDTHGYAMEMPTDITWALSDDSFGTIENGTLVSNGKLGEVEIQVVSGGNIVGSKTALIANPTTLQLSSASTVLPYSTAQKPRKVELPIVATIGEQKVFFDASSFEITSSVPAAGTINNMTFVATTDETIASTVLTIKYLPTSQKLTFTINFGKGSDLLWDFEDGDISNWYGGDQDVKAWLTENGVAEDDQLKTLISGGQISYSEQSHTFLSTRENGGQVHNGNNALGVNFDFRNVEFNSWVYAILYNVQDQYVLRDVANGKNATALGMWCYVPEGFCNPTGDTSGALSMQLTVYKNPQGTSGSQLNFQFYSEKQKKRVSLNQCTEADIPENRWVYLTADLTGSNYYSLPNPKGTSYREPSFLRMYIKPTRAQVLTYYFDDFTLDYSSAVDDREAPIITNTTYCLADTNIELNNQTINTNTVSFDANIADYAAPNSEGLNYASAAIYVDGVKLDGVTASANVMGVKNVVLSNGTHAIKFEIYDNIGNFSSVTKNITVDADATKATVSLTGHNDKGNVPESDSIYYIDLVASDIAQISSVTATIKLNTANTWELDNMIPATGYEAAYTYNDISKLATVTVTKVGKSNLTGEQTIVSLPTRIWSFDESTAVGGDGTPPTHLTKEQRFSSYGEPKVFVDASVVSGAITYTNNSTGTFGGSISVTTKLSGNKVNGMWHQHTASATADLAPTCTEAGYTGRTYCDDCGSVVDWGTTVPATGHTYELIENQFVCAVCGDVYDSGTGLFDMNGTYYYSIAGNLIMGWQNIDGVYHLFDTDYKAVTGNQKIGGIHYKFGEDGALLHNVFVTDANGIKCYYGPSNYVRGWQIIEGEKYYFDEQGYALTGYGVIRVNRNDPNSDTLAYRFTDDGKYIEDVTDSGLITTGKGDVYYIENGKTVHAGLIHVQNNYYYITGTGKAAVGTYNITQWWTNDLLPAGTYEFDTDGKMINPPFILDETFTGLFEGTYYENGVPTHVGLIKVDGDYYYINGVGKAVTGTYNVTQWWTNDLLPAGTYEFDTDGKMINPPFIPDETFTGLFEGTYYENGVPTHVGLIKVDGDYYYINGVGKAVTGTYNVTKWWTNDLLPAGTYEFDTDGKMINPPFIPDETFTGLFEGYYYVNGERTHAGLINIDGDYYYINGVGKAVTGTYNVTKWWTNDLLPAGTYEFDDNGKMIF